MMRSISPRWASLKLCARGRGGDAGERESGGGRTEEGERIAGSLLVSYGAWRRAGFIGDDVVGANPSGRTGGKAGFGAGGKVARGAVVAAREGGLRGGEIGLGEVALAAVGHGELAVAVRHVGFARDRGTQQRDRFVRRLHVVGGDERLGEHDANEGRVGGEHGGAAQRSDRFRGMPALEQRLALHL